MLTLYNAQQLWFYNGIVATGYHLVNGAISLKCNCKEVKKIPVYEDGDILAVNWETLCTEQFWTLREQGSRHC